MGGGGGLHANTAPRPPSFFLDAVSRIACSVTNQYLIFRITKMLDTVRRRRIAEVSTICINKSTNNGKATVGFQNFSGTSENIIIFLA